MTLLIAVIAIANLMPPSSAWKKLTPTANAMTVNTISIIGAAPNLMIGSKILLARSIIVCINFFTPYYVSDSFSPSDDLIISNFLF